MYYDIIELNENNSERKEKSILLKTIYGDVFAPISVCTIVDNRLWCPSWIFSKKNLNACMMVSGFVSTIQV